MRTLTAGVATAAIVTMILLIAPTPGKGQDHLCSVRNDAAGSWVFATGLGQLFHRSGQAITAIGTMNIEANGNVSGTFDNTIAQLGISRQTYSGSVEVNPDCTGTLMFTTSGGGSRTDSIVILENGTEIWGMSRDHLLPWTYTVKRIHSSSRRR
jgi:hypothetical protein